MNPQQLHNAIDACRPGRDDHREPELAALAERLAQDAEARAVYDHSQRLDAALGAAFRDVPLPAGLEDRLLAAVGGASPKTVEEKIAAPAKTSTAAGTRRISRRQLLSTGALAAAVLVAAGVAAIVRWTGDREVAPDQLVAQAQQWLGDEDFQRDDAWKPLDERPLRAFPQGWLAVRPVQWRSMATSLDRKAVVYRVPHRGGSAYVFVIAPRADVTGLGATPPRTPLPGATGGWRIGAWQADGVLYVLATQGEYRSLLRVPQTV
jgi:hypothetical protein